MLVILNELPSTSMKYEFVLATADRILTENVQLGHAELLVVNQAALASSFSRTSELLRRALQRSSSITATWQSGVLSLLPLGPRLAAFYDGLRLCLGGLFPPAAAGALRPCKPQRQMTANADGWLEAEKLAHELLWITNKLRASSAVSEAIVRWAFASGLASLWLAAHSRVQGPIVKITDLIAGLPWEDQVIILRNWLEDFSACDSDWPNLSRSFERWCRYSRKLLRNSSSNAS